MGSQLNSVPTVHSMSQENKTENTICCFENSMLPTNSSRKEKKSFPQSQLSEEVEEK